MRKELIGKATRDECREAMVNFVLRRIDMIFEGAGLSARNEFEPQMSGERPGRVEQYYANVDFSSYDDIVKLTTAFAEVIARLEQEPEPATKTIEALVRRMERDGFFIRMDGLLLGRTLSRHLP